MNTNFPPSCIASTNGNFSNQEYPLIQVKVKKDISSLKVQDVFNFYNPILEKVESHEKALASMKPYKTFKKIIFIASLFSCGSVLTLLVLNLSENSPYWKANFIALALLMCLSAGASAGYNKIYDRRVEIKKSLKKNLIIKELCCKFIDFSKTYQALKKGEHKITSLFLKYFEIRNLINSSPAEGLLNRDELSMLSVGHICLMDGIAKILLQYYGNSNLPSEWETELELVQNSQENAISLIWDEFELPTPSKQDYSNFKARKFFLNTLEFDLDLIQFFRNVMLRQENIREVGEETKLI